MVESALELKTNTELTRQIHALTTELHRRVVWSDVVTRSEFDELVAAAMTTLPVNRS